MLTVSTDRLSLGNAPCRTPPQHPLRSAFGAPSKALSGLHGSIGLPSAFATALSSARPTREFHLPRWLAPSGRSVPARASGSLVSRLCRDRFVGAWDGLTLACLRTPNRPAVAICA